MGRIKRNEAGRQQTSFTQKEVAAILEMNPGTLQGWSRDGLIVPSVANPKGRGSTRLYSASDLTLIKILSILSGMSYDRDIIKSLTDFMNKVGVSKISRKEYHLNPHLVHKKTVLLKLYNCSWEFGYQDEFATGTVEDHRVILTINVSKIMTEIRAKL